MQLKRLSISDYWYWYRIEFIIDSATSEPIFHRRWIFHLRDETWTYQGLFHIFDERTSQQTHVGVVYGCIYNPGSLCIHTREGQTFAQLLFLQMPGKSRKKRNLLPFPTFGDLSKTFPLECKRIFRACVWKRISLTLIFNRKLLLNMVKFIYLWSRFKMIWNGK